jgi:REP-associated tyrosine transposase
VYLLELDRYLHLNPVRAQGVPSLGTLDRFPWTDHSVLMGTVPRAWQKTATILAQFGSTVTRARRAYHAFLATGLPQGRCLKCLGTSRIENGGLARPPMSSPPLLLPRSCIQHHLEERFRRLRA